MKQKNYLSILFLFVFFSLFSKWLVLILYYDNHIFTNIISSIKDPIYFPIIISLSNFELSPTYLNSISNPEIISFPLYGIISHAFFYKIFGVYSFIILEFVFRILFFYVFYLCINKIFENKFKTLFFCISTLLIILIMELITLNTETRYISIIFNVLIENLGSRVPRPLITSIFYFLFFLTIFDLKKEVNHKINFKYFLFIIFLLSCFLNSFFYHF